MAKQHITGEPTPATAKRLPVYMKGGHRLREGDFFKVRGRNNWWRFVAYVIPDHGDGYVECVELKEKGSGVPRGGGKVKTGALRCIDGGKIREVG